MFSRLVRYYRARSMRWAVRRLKNAGPAEMLFFERHRATRRRQATLWRTVRMKVRHRSRLIDLIGDDPFQAPMVRWNPVDTSALDSNNILEDENDDDARLDP